MIKSFKVLLFLSLLMFFATGIWASDLDEIISAIEENGLSWQAGNTTISELSDQERAMLCGTIIPNIGDLKTSNIFTYEANKALPAYWDWRDKDGENWVTSVKDQGGCGSCWAFAATGEFESLIMITYGVTYLQPDLSEQHLVSTCCSAGDCNGGYTDQVHNYLRSSGVPDEACYPYKGQNSPCSETCADWQLRAEKIKSWNWVCTSEANTTAIKNAIVQAPLSTTMSVYEDFFYYTGGVYQHTWGNYSGGHAIVIIGYDDALDCWIVKNSWGTGWGEAGFFRIKRGDSGIGKWTTLSTYEASNDNLPPFPPTLLTPASGSIDQGPVVNFTWLNNGDPDNDYVRSWLYVEEKNASVWQNIINHDAGDNESYSSNIINPDKFYRWKVCIYDPAQNSNPYESCSAYWKFNNSPPNPPTLLEPLNGADGLGPEVTFKWHRNGDPDGDKVRSWLYVDEWNGSQWTQVVAYHAGSWETYKAMLNMNKDFRWRVKVYDQEQNSDPYEIYSDYWYLYTYVNDNQPPYPPTLITPANGAADINPTVAFSWQRNGDPNGDTVRSWLHVQKWNGSAWQEIISYTNLHSR